MNNHHLRNRGLSLKGKGLLSLMLSLPPDWDYSMRGLAAICPDGISSIRSGIAELEKQGYLSRRRLRGENGQLGDIEYTIFEEPVCENPTLEKPMLENPTQAFPTLENRTERNIDKSSTKKSTTNSFNAQSINPSPDSTDTMDSRAVYREMIEENIEYEHLCDTHTFSRDILAEILDLMVETVCSAKSTIRIGGEDRPGEAVRGRFLKIGSEHIAYVLERLSQNTTEVRNIRSYLLTSIYNAPATIGSYYQSRVNHDLYGEEDTP